MRNTKENSEVLAQQAKSVGAQVGSGPTIELVTPQPGRSGEPSRACLPSCQPSCPPSIFKGPCPPDYRLPRPPGPPRPN